VHGKPLLDFVYRDKGSLISLSKAGSVGNVMGNLSKDFTFEGKVARFMYITLYRMHQYTLHGFFRTALLILRDRLARRTGPKLKLH
jgi:NADH dehydrogenase